MDDTIRRTAAEIVLPYWVPSRQGPAVFQQRLDAKPATAALIRSIETRRNGTGALVRYEVDGREYESDVVFAYKPVMEETR
jgi:hypothetical protein